MSGKSPPIDWVNKTLLYSCYALGPVTGPRWRQASNGCTCQWNQPEVWGTSSVRASSGGGADGDVASAVWSLGGSLGAGDHQAETQSRRTAARRSSGDCSRQKTPHLSHRQIRGQEGYQVPWAEPGQVEGNQTVLGRRGWAGTQQSQETIKSHCLLDVHSSPTRSCWPSRGRALGGVDRGDPDQPGHVLLRWHTARKCEARPTRAHSTPECPSPPSQQSGPVGWDAARSSAFLPQTQIRAVTAVLCLVDPLPPTLPSS